MRRFIVMLFIFIFSVFLGLKLAHDPGLAFFSYQTWSMEMPLWFAGLCLLVLLLLVYWVAQAIDAVGFSMYRFRTWRTRRRQAHAYTKTQQGLLALIEGDWQRAERQLMAGVSESAGPLLNYIAAAHAADRQGAYEQRDAYLHTAATIAPEADLTIGITRVELLLRQGLVEQALATVLQLQRLAPKNPRVLQLSERVYVQQGDWQALLDLLPRLQKAKLLNAEEAMAFELRLYRHLFQGLQKKSDQGTAVRILWDQLPRRLQKNPETQLLFVEAMLPYPEAAAELEGMLVKILNQGWNEKAVQYYGLLESAAPTKQLARAEGWLKHYPKQSQLFLALGRICMRCQLWGKARTYYELSLKAGPDPKTYIAYGHLLETLGESDKAFQSYRAGLLLPSSTP